MIVFSFSLVKKSSLKSGALDETTYASKEECQEKSRQGCICMITKNDTQYSNPDCVGWEPVKH